MPLLLYGTESCPLTKADVQSLDFTVMRFLMKIFKSSNRDLIINCIGYFNFFLPSDLIERRQANFTAKLDKLPNSIHRLY
jgi:dTDP-4-dehydrorhamnose reductase